MRAVATYTAATCFSLTRLIYGVAVIQKAQAAYLEGCGEGSVDERVTCSAGSEDYQRRRMQCLVLDRR